ncbi:unnamed protein product [Rangifer tarandus platyrhynchus]|uniref:Uncharacterized protein n=2 Tax=Rangifer tarandus platyrhynchus TaxID=3082113 RepID=A0ABN8YXT2_RANTA|nr:unnamed protein product [Rangifer tarandus platyrhynchus]
MLSFKQTFSLILISPALIFMGLYYRVFLVAQRLKSLPAMQETWVQPLGREDRLEKKMATHSSILSWRNPWTEKPGGLQSMGLQRVGHDWVGRVGNFTFTFTLYSWRKGKC